MMVVAALMVTSSAGPGSASLAQLNWFVQLTPSPPPSQNTAEGVVRSSSVVTCSGTERRSGRRLSRGPSQFGISVRSIFTSPGESHSARTADAGPRPRRARGAKSLGSGKKRTIDTGLLRPAQVTQQLFESLLVAN